MLTIEIDTNKKTSIEYQLKAAPAGNSCFLHRDMRIVCMKVNLAGASNRPPEPPPPLARRAARKPADRPPFGGCLDAVLLVRTGPCGHVPTPWQCLMLPFVRGTTMHLVVSCLHAEGRCIRVYGSVIAPHNMHTCPVEIEGIRPRTHCDEFHKHKVSDVREDVKTTLCACLLKRYE